MSEAQLLEFGQYSFECLRTRGWLHISPSIAIYDITVNQPIETVINNMKNGEYLKGASGALYRLSKC